MNKLRSHQKQSSSTWIWLAIALVLTALLAIVYLLITYPQSSTDNKSSTPSTTQSKPAQNTEAPGETKGPDPDLNKPK